MTTIQLQAIPTFRILDHALAMSFYRGFLGFNIDWEHRMRPGEPVYMQISMHGLLLHLSENPRFPAGSIVFMETAGIDEYAQQLQKKEHIFPIPAIESTFWGTRQMEIDDPFGNLLRFNEAVREG